MVNHITSTIRKKFEIGEYSHGEQYGPAITYYRRKYVDRTVSIEDEIVKI